ncbi:MAG: hypothetical protein P8Y37_13295, partial [Anaerolineales bacterium]
YPEEKGQNARADPRIAGGRPGNPAQGYPRLLSTELDIEVVGEAKDGEEALVQTAALQPEVILMDLVVPKQRINEGQAHSRAWP